MAKQLELMRWMRWIFVVLALAGGGLLGVFLRLPASESGSAVVGGFSLIRIGLLLAHLLALMVILVGLGASFFQPDRVQRNLVRLKALFARRPILYSAVTGLGWMMVCAGVGLDLLLNPALFPRAILYQFLYVRIRPLWLLVTCAACGVLIFQWVSGWRRDLFPNRMSYRARHWAGMGCIGLATALNGWTWFQFLNLGSGWLPANEGWIAVDAAMFITGLFLVLREPQPRSAGVLAVSREGSPRAGRTRQIGAGAFGLLLLLIWTGCLVYGSTLRPALDDPNLLPAFRQDRILSSAVHFGFNQLRGLPGWVTAFALAGGIVLSGAAGAGRSLEVYQKRASAALEGSCGIRWATAASLGGVFFLLRSGVKNADLRLFEKWYPDNAARMVTHVRFDEMWESNLHFELYRLGNRWLGMDVDTIFSILSCLAGVMAVYLILRAAMQLTPGDSALFLVIWLSGGYMQLFFGDMEAYTLTSAWLIAYLLAGVLYLRRTAPFELPCLLLGTTLTFHMLGVYLIPSLLALGMIELHRQRSASLLAGLAILGMVISLSLQYFALHGVDVQYILDTSWGLGRGGNILANFTNADPTYFAGQMNLLALVLPLFWMVLPLVIRGIDLQKEDLFLTTASACGAVFFVLWKSSIGLYSDFNLYSAMILPAAILIVTWLVRSLKGAQRGWRIVAAASTLLAWLATFSWIWGNHFPD